MGLSTITKKRCRGRGKAYRCLLASPWALSQLRRLGSEGLLVQLLLESELLLLLLLELRRLGILQGRAGGGVGDGRRRRRPVGLGRGGEDGLRGGPLLRVLQRLEGAAARRERRLRGLLLLNLHLLLLLLLLELELLLLNLLLELLLLLLELQLLLLELLLLLGEIGGLRLLLRACGGDRGVGGGDRSRSRRSVEARGAGPERGPALGLRRPRRGRTERRRRERAGQGRLLLLLLGLGPGHGRVGRASAGGLGHERRVLLQRRRLRVRVGLNLGRLLLLLLWLCLGQAHAAAVKGGGEATRALGADRQVLHADHRVCEEAATRTGRRVRRTERRRTCTARGEGSRGAMMSDRRRKKVVGRGVERVVRGLRCSLASCCWRCCCCCWPVYLLIRCGSDSRRAASEME